MSGWHHLYRLSWSALDADAITQAGDAIAGELGGQVQINTPEPGLLETFFTIPVSTLSQLEGPSFREQLHEIGLANVRSLTLELLFQETPAGVYCTLTAISENGSNAVCPQTVESLIQRMAARLA